MEAKRIAVLDALKGMAILGVLLGHYGTEGMKTAIISNFVENGVRTVQLFFVISVFLALTTLTRVPLTTPPIVLGGWYVGALVLTYIFLILYCRYWKDRKLYVLLWISVVVCFCSCAASIFSSNENVAGYLRRFSFWGQMPVIVIGIIVYHLYNNKIIKLDEERRKYISYTLRIIAYCLVISMATVRLGSPFGQIVFGIAFGCLVISLLCYDKSILNNKIFCIFGRYSYGIYLFHLLFIGGLKEYIGQINMNVYLRWLLGYGVLAGSALAVSVILTNVVEKPAMRFYYRVGLLNRK